MEDIGSRAMPFVSSQIDEARSFIADLLCQPEIAPLGDAGNFRACAQTVDFGKMHFLSLSFGTRVSLDVDIANAGVKTDALIMVCLKGRGEIEIDGQRTEINAETGLLSCPRGRLSADLSEDCERVLLSADARIFNMKAHAPLQDLRFDRPRLRPFLDQILLIASSPHLIGSLKEDPVLAEATGRLLGQMLRHGMQASEGQAEHLIASGSVVRAEALIRRRAEEPLQINDISGAIGVPVRTLQNNFRQYRDYTPMEYLRSVRLQFARERLASADEGTRVISVALNCGFTHLGRFASEYLARYGERPSATLRRRLDALAAARKRMRPKALGGALAAA